jgi:hypothetical protein
LEKFKLKNKLIHSLYHSYNDCRKNEPLLQKKTMKEFNKGKTFFFILRQTVINQDVKVRILDKKKLLFILTPTVFYTLSELKGFA